MSKNALALSASLSFTTALVAQTAASPTLAAPAPLAPAAPAGETVELERLTVFSSRVALQEPGATMAAPVSALRFEPQVDVQARNFAEGQADVTIRGGTFENTGFSVGALPIYDPQTGHYSAELPVSPYLLGVPEVRTGAAQAATGFNATAGGIAYGWRPVRTGGAVSVAGGDNDLARGEVYAGVVAPGKTAGFTVGADVSVAASQSNGAVTNGDHDFARYNGRVQLATETGQTDFFAGYQSKFFGWPNLYARGGNPETENLQTRLFAANHRSELGADGDYVQVGAYYRDNRDDYEFNRFLPGLFNPFEHRTIVRGAALDGRVSVADATALRFAGGVADDEIESTSLVVGPTNGRFLSRTQTYAGLAAEQVFALAEDRELVATAGGRVDDSNRDGSEFSPSAELALRQEKGALRRAHLGYSETSQVPTYQALNASSVGGLFRGDRDLPRATTGNLEVGAELALAGWTAHTALFLRRDRDLLDYVFTTPASARNAVAVDLDTVGAEVFARRGWERFDLLLGYTYLHKDDDYTAPNGGSFYALNHAEHRLTLGGIARLGAGFELRMDNELRRQAENPLRQEGRDNVDTALGLFYSVPRVDGLVLNVQAENLWDTAYQDVPLVPHTPRTWSAGATYAW
jgi:hypothetical protein